MKSVCDPHMAVTEIKRKTTMMLSPSRTYVIRLVIFVVFLYLYFYHNYTLRVINKSLRRQRISITQGAKFVRNMAEIKKINLLNFGHVCGVINRDFKHQKWKDKEIKTYETIAASSLPYNSESLVITKRQENEVLRGRCRGVQKESELETRTWNSNCKQIVCKINRKNTGKERTQSDCQLNLSL